MAKAMGCKQLELQLAALASDLHVYGHSHVTADVALPQQPAVPAGTAAATGLASGGTATAAVSASTRRYVHHPLDGQYNGPTLYCIWDGALGLIGTRVDAR